MTRPVTVIFLAGFSLVVSCADAEPDSRRATRKTVRVSDGDDAMTGSRSTLEQRTNGVVGMTDASDPDDLNGPLNSEEGDTVYSSRPDVDGPGPGEQQMPPAGNQPSSSTSPEPLDASMVALASRLNATHLDAPSARTPVTGLQVVEGDTIDVTIAKDAQGRYVASRRSLSVLAQHQGLAPTVATARAVIRSVNPLVALFDYSDSSVVAFTPGETSIKILHEGVSKTVKVRVTEAATAPAPYFWIGEIRVERRAIAGPWGLMRFADRADIMTESMAGATFTSSDPDVASVVTTSSGAYIQAKSKVGEAVITMAVGAIRYSRVVRVMGATLPAYVAEDQPRLTFALALGSMLSIFYCRRGHEFDVDFGQLGKTSLYMIEEGGSRRLGPGLAVRAIADNPNILQPTPGSSNPTNFNCVAEGDTTVFIEYRGLKVSQFVRVVK